MDDADTSYCNECKYFREICPLVRWGRSTTNNGEHERSVIKNSKETHLLRKSNANIIIVQEGMREIEPI